MNINELDELAKEWNRFDADNEYSQSLLELIAAYREAVAVIKGSNCMCWSGCEICENWPTDEQALATAKRLGIDQL